MACYTRDVISGHLLLHIIQQDVLNLTFNDDTKHFSVWCILFLQFNLHEATFQFFFMLLNNTLIKKLVCPHYS